MAFVFTFKTSTLDVTSEPENPINPIYGKALLDWLKPKVAGDVQLSEPDAEDWGWYSLLDWNGRGYLVGAIAYYEKGDSTEDEIEWVFQIDKQRSFIESLLGREKMVATDPCVAYFRSVLEKEPSFKDFHSEQEH